MSIKSQLSAMYYLSQVNPKKYELKYRGLEVILWEKVISARGGFYVGNPWEG